MDWKKHANKYVGVIGAGGFGTAVANLLAYNTDVLLYTRNDAVFQAMQQNRKAAGQQLSAAITPTMDLNALAKQCKVIFPIVPAQSLGLLLEVLAPLLTSEHIIIHGIKGLQVNWPQSVESDQLPILNRAHIKTMSELIQEQTCITQVGCLAGPNLASELAQGQPAASVIASQSALVLEQGQQLLRSERFQIYTNQDLLGVELCGSLKNIIAIGAGCLGGLGYGENAKALLISRGLVEMVYIGKAMGASVQPFLGLAGIGDLVATCASTLSRNYSLGYKLAKGERLNDILRTTTDTIEGIHTVKTIARFMKGQTMRTPITETIYRVLFENLAVADAIQYLMHYPIDEDVNFL